jgi:predicted RNA binding protein YcfA (HicA-like mRNA interferase family)
MALLCLRTRLRSSIPSARAEEFRRVAARLGFQRLRQTGGHERWAHQDGRAVTIPIHGGREIGTPLYNRILQQLGVSSEEFRNLK